MKTRDERITSFICEAYCQNCDNSKCNAYGIMEKYQTESLTPTHMEEVNEFRPDKRSCANHRSNEGSPVFIHIVKVHYMDGRVGKKGGWLTAGEISEIWEDDVEYVDIIFTDI